MDIKVLIAVIKKEFKSYFNHPLAYIMLSLFIGVSYFFFFRGVFLSGEATVRPYFEVLTWFLLFLVPAITMRSFAAERKDGTLEVMLAQPMTELELLVGKFIADFLFVLLAIAITITLPLTLMLGGKLDLGVVFAQYVGSFFLIGAMVSIGIWASSMTKNQTVSLLSGISAIFALTVIGLDVVVLGVPYPINNIFQDLSLLTHFQNITRGVIDLRDIIYFLSVTAIFMGFTYLTLMARKLNRKSKNYQNLQIGIGLIAVIAIVINLFGYFINWRMDFTSEKLYSLSTGTRQVLKELDDKITVKFYASQELPPQVSGIYRDVRDTLEDYQNTSGGKMQIIYKFPDSSSDAKEEAEKDGVPPMQFNIYQQEEFQAKEGYMGLVLNYSDKKESIPFVQRTDDFEYQLTSLIRKMTTGVKRKVLVTAGHGEKDLSQDYGAFNQEISKQYTVEPIDKKKLTVSALKKADVLVIAGPKQDFSKKERLAIKEYIDGGGKTLALIDSVDVNPQYMFAQPVKKNFADFFKQYGVNVQANLVYDLKANEKVTFGSGEAGGYVLPYPFWISAQPASTQSIVTTGLKSVTVPWASSIDVAKARGRYTTLLSTTAYAGVQKGNFNIAPTKNTSVSEKGLKQYNLAVSTQDMSNGGRLIVVGDADFLSNQFVQQNQAGLAFGLNAVDWLGQDEILIGIRSKNAAPSKLVFSSDATKNFVRYFNNIGIVLLIALYGFYRLTMRRKKTSEAYIE